MTATAAEYFVSYSRKDGNFALELASGLREAGVDLWLDQLDIRAGDRWDESVETALRNCSGVIVVLSPDALASAHVMDELSYALDEGKRVVPVLHRACDLPLRLRRVQYVDFTRDAEGAFERLRQSLDDAGTPTPNEDRVGHDSRDGKSDRGWARTRDAAIGFFALGCLAVLGLPLTALLPTEIRYDIATREPGVIVFTFVASGLVGALAALASRRNRWAIAAVVASVLVCWAIGLLMDPRYEGTQGGIFAGGLLGALVAFLVRLRSDPRPV